MVTQIEYNAYIRQLWAVRPLAPVTLPRKLMTASSVQLRTHNIQQQIKKNFPTALKEVSDRFTAAETSSTKLMRAMAAASASLSADSAPTSETVKQWSAQVQEFTQHYNDIISTVHANSEMINADILMPLLTCTEQKQALLKKAGLSVNADQTISVDPEMLEDALTDEPNAVSDMLVGSDGLTKQIILQSQTIHSTALSTLLKTGSSSRLPSDFTTRQRLTQYHTMSNMNLFFSNMYSSGGFLSAEA